MYSSTPYFTIIGVFYDYITTYNHTNLANFGYFFFGGGEGSLPIRAKFAHCTKISSKSVYPVTL